MLGAVKWWITVCTYVGAKKKLGRIHKCAVRAAMYSSTARPAMGPPRASGMARCEGSRQRTNVQVDRALSRRRVCDSDGPDVWSRQDKRRTFNVGGGDVPGRGSDSGIDEGGSQGEVE